MRYYERVERTTAKWLLLVELPWVAILALGLWRGYAKWAPPGDVEVTPLQLAFFFLGLLLLLLLVLIPIFVIGKYAKKQVPYKMKDQVSVQMELDKSLTLSDIMIAVAPDIQFEIVAVARWKDMGTRIGSLVATTVFGILASNEYRAGFIGISNRKLIVVTIGAIVGENITLEKLDYAFGARDIQTAPLEKIRVKKSVLDHDVTLTFSGAISFKATFPDSFDETNTTNARAIAMAIKS